MATEDFQDILERLYYDRRLLSALVFEPLQEIKDFVARNLRSDEIPRIAGLLGNAIRSDTLRTITDGEALIAVLNLYYGKDNLRVLQRLLRKINCHDLLEILSEWDVRSNPVNSRVFRGMSWWFISFPSLFSFDLLACSYRFKIALIRGKLNVIEGLRLLFKLYCFCGYAKHMIWVCADLMRRFMPVGSLKQSWSLQDKNLMLFPRNTKLCKKNSGVCFVPQGYFVCPLGEILGLKKS